MIYRNSAVFDFETTGLDPVQDTILEVAALRIRNGHVVGSFHELADPQRPIPGEITKLTGITDAMVAGCGTVDQVICQLMAFVGGDTLLIGHNVAFDLGFLDVAHRRVFGRPVRNPFLDTRAMCIKRFPYQSTKLEAVCRQMGIELHGAHRALNDVTATWELCKALWDEAAVADEAQGMQWYINRILHFRKYADDKPFVPAHGILEMVG